MTYRRDEEHYVERDAAGVPMERHVVAEERTPEPVYDAPPVQRDVVRERVVEQPVVEQPVYAAPVRDQVVASDAVVADEAADRWSMLDLATRLIWFLTGLLLVGLVLRFLFKATGANAGSGFVSFVYNSTAVFVAPFRGIFTDSVSGNNVFEVSTLVAIVVWALVAFFVTWLLGILLGGPSRGVREYRREVRRY
jgi:hypothetical protein